MTTVIDSDKVTDYYVKRLSGKWEVTMRTSNGVQVKKIKKVNMLGFWAGLCLIPFWGIGFIMWLLVILEYAFQREKHLFISIDQMARQLRGDK